MTDDERRRHREYMRSYYRGAGGERMRARSRRYYHQNKLKVAQQPSRQPEAKRAYNAAHYAAHRDERRAAWRAWAVANPGKLKSLRQRYHRRHRLALAERRRAYFRRYYREHKEDFLARTETRRARLAAASGSFTAREFRDKGALLGNVCIYCGEAKPLTVDHKIPLSRGGTNDISNIVPACRSCNARKGTRTAREYLEAAA